MALKIEVTKAEKVFEALGLQEHSVYKILVKMRLDNPTHVSFLFTGFKNGNYCQIYCNSSDPTPMMEAYSIKIVRRLCSIKTNEKDIEKENEKLEEKVVDEELLRYLYKRYPDEMGLKGVANRNKREGFMDGMEFWKTEKDG